MFHIKSGDHSTILETSYGNDNGFTDKEDIIKNENDSSLVNIFDEARYNLATRIMSNGVEVIIASDKTKTPDQDIMPHHQNNNKPMTLAASTISNQLMILLLPSSSGTDSYTEVSSAEQKPNMNLPFHTNHFITKTCLTTYTYRTTYIQDGHTIIDSREKVISNIATEERNYPKIVPSQTVGVTLTRTPELAVGIFPTTFSYFNIFKDINNVRQIMTSEHTVVNTITGPNDYLAYLQTAAESTPPWVTNTYYNEVILTNSEKKIQQTIKRNLTQVVVTKSYISSTYDTGKNTILALDNKNEKYNIVNTYSRLEANKPLDDIHIYATKTLLTTLTYYTTNVLNSYYTSTDKTNQKHKIKPLSSTEYKYHTRIIENVVTNSVPVTLLPSELINKMRLELRKQKQTNNNQYRLRNIITTLATLKDGQTIKISAIQALKPTLEITSVTQSSLYDSPVIAPTLDSSNVTFLADNNNNNNNNKIITQTTMTTTLVEDKNKIINKQVILQENSLYTPTRNFSTEQNLKQPPSLHSNNTRNKNKNNNKDENSNLLTLPSEPIAFIVESPPSKNNSKNQTKNSIIEKVPSSPSSPPSSSTTTNKIIQRLTALKPMLNAMADLWQNKFGVNKEHSIKHIKNVESKQAPNNKVIAISNKQNLTSEISHPIYIPVQTSPLSIDTTYDNVTNFNDFVAQSLHIQPPLIVRDETITANDDLQTQMKGPSNKISSSTLASSAILRPQQQPLHNGGIYIRPGEIITANSDVIVGKPNGIEYVHIPNRLNAKKENIIQEKFNLNNHQYPFVTYYQNKIQHTYKKNPVSTLTTVSNKFRPPQWQHIPIGGIGSSSITNNNMLPQPNTNLRPPNVNFDKNILKPPPPPPPKQPPSPTTSPQLSLLSPKFPSQHEVDLIIPFTYKEKNVKSQVKQDFQSTSPTVTKQNHNLFATSSQTNQGERVIGFQNLYNINNELRNNEILEIQRVPQIFSADLKPSSTLSTTTKYATQTPIENEKEAISSDNNHTSLEDKLTNWQSRQKIQHQHQQKNQESPNILNSVFVQNYWQNAQRNQPPATITTTLPKNSENTGKHSEFDKPIQLKNVQEEKMLPHVSFKQHYTNKDHINLIPNIVYLNESRLQNVNLDQFIFSHTVDVNVPPLTFKREDIDYPQLTNPAVRGHIPQPVPITNQKDLKLLMTKTEPTSPYKYMPLIKIPANEQQVQVSLTPTNIGEAIGVAVPIKLATEQMVNDSINLKKYKISWSDDRNIKLFDQNQSMQDQKTYQTKNFLQIKPRNEANNDWKQHKIEQQQLHKRNKGQTPLRTVEETLYTHNNYTVDQKGQLETYQTNIKIPFSTKIYNNTSSPSFIKNPTKSSSAKNESTNIYKNIASQLHVTEATKPVSGGMWTAVKHLKPYNSSSENSIHSNSSADSNKWNNTRNIQFASPSKTHETISQTLYTEQIKSLTGKPFRKPIKPGYNDIQSTKIQENLNSSSTNTTTIIVAPGDVFKPPYTPEVKKLFNNGTYPKLKNVSSDNELHEIFITHETQYPKEKQQQLEYKNISQSTKTPIFKVNENLLSISKPSVLVEDSLVEPNNDHITTIDAFNDFQTHSTAMLKHKQEQQTQRPIEKSTTADTKFNSINTTTQKPLQAHTDYNDSNFNDGDGNSFKHTSFTTQKSKERKTVKLEDPEINENLTEIESNSDNPTNILNNEGRKTNEHFKFNYELQPSEISNEQIVALTTTQVTESAPSITKTLARAPSLSSTLTYTTTTTTMTTTTIKRIILPTKYITTKYIYTVTTTARPSQPSSSSSAVSPPASVYNGHRNQLNSSQTTPSLAITTLYLTHTQINTIIDTITTVETKTETATATSTLDPITITATSTLTAPQPFNTIDSSNMQKNVYTSYVGQQSNVTYLPYPTIEVVSNNITYQEYSNNSNENSIFIIMTNNSNRKKNTDSSSSSTFKQNSKNIDLPLPNINDFQQIEDGNNEEIIIEYDNAISFDDMPIRDEEQPQTFNGQSSSGISDNKAAANEVFSNDHIILDKVLIATPTNKILHKHFYSNSSSITTDSVNCRPECKTTLNEDCFLVEKYWACLCRPGFARMFPDRPCKPTYTYIMLMHAERIGNYPLQYIAELQDNKTEHYKRLAQLINNALDRMIMQSDFRDAYHEVHVTTFSEDETNNSGVKLNVVLQLSDNTNAKRLEEVFKKDLRLNNYSIGGTELHTNKAGVDALTINDFNECLSRKHHDCSENAHCFNLPGTYTCSCREGFADLSENPTYPGRICSSEQIGCNVCYYHGKCFSLDSTNLSNKSNGSERMVCECFAWYAGSKCQVNLKILLIVLLGIGTLLLILLLFCILITCTKRRKNQQHLHTVLAAPSTVTSSSEGLQHKSFPKARNLLITSLGMNGSLRSTKNVKRQRTTKIEKCSMIKDSSSETSQTSLPYALKDNESLTIKNNKRNEKRASLKNYNKKYQNYCSYLNTVEPQQYTMPVALNRSDNLNTILSSASSSFKESNNTRTNQQQLISANSYDNEGHYCEQSDRSLTVMIPRAKYHHSLLLSPQTQLLHHQLMERVYTTSKSENKTDDLDNKSEITKKDSNTSSFLRDTTNNKSSDFPQNPGALISAGFEVSAIVNNSTSLFNAAELQHNNSFVPFGIIPPSKQGHNTPATTTSDPATSVDTKALLKNISINNYEAESDYNVNKCENKSAEARSFDETTIRISTKPMQISVTGAQTHQIQDEVNTMAERDLGSTFLLPHTHLYKPEKLESELSGFDSF